MIIISSSSPPASHPPCPETKHPGSFALATTLQGPHWGLVTGPSSYRTIHHVYSPEEWHSGLVHGPGFTISQNTKSLSTWYIFFLPL